MEKSSFFNSVGGDRVYKAEEWAEYFASFIGNGVFPAPSDGLQVEANGSAGIVLRAGRAWINGYFYFNTDDLNIELNTADGVLNRVDRIVIRWDLTARTISVVVKSSAPSANPTAPALQRDADAYELCLADVFVRAGSTSVLQSDITDQRYNSSLCGIVAGTVDQIDASALSKQFNDYAELFKEETKLDFEAWFEEIRGILAEDIAGSLALAIDDINQSKAQPSGIATLDSNGKLVQMPTAADVGAIKLRWSTIINETTATPNKYNFDDYITPGDVVSVDNYASAQSAANIPEQVPGKLYVLPLRTDDQGRNDLMQEYHTTTGKIYVRPRYYYSGNAWSKWSGTMPDRVTEQLYVFNVTPGYRNFDSYLTTGVRISVLSNNTAASIYNCPSKYSGLLEVTALSDDILMQTYHDAMSVTYTRTNSDGAWHNWDSSDSVKQYTLTVTSDFEITLTSSTSGQTVPRYQLYKNSSMVYFYINFKCHKSLNARVDYAFGSVPQSIAPPFTVAGQGVSNITPIVLWVRSSGEVLLRPSANIAAESELEGQMTWISK